MSRRHSWSRPAIAVCSLSLATLVLASCATAEHDRPEDGRLNLILITVDTLRADHLGTYGYFRDTSPTIDRLGREGVVFENAIAAMATTLPSHASLLTSTYPARHGVLSNLRFFKQPVVTTDELQTAAQLLEREGYTTAAFTSASPLSEVSGIQAGFQVFRGPPPYETRRERIDLPAHETTGRVLDWLDAASPPFFLWVHLFDPHHPYAPPPPFVFPEEQALDDLIEERRIPEEFRADAVSVFNHYDGEVRYADDQIKRILKKLRMKRFYENSVIVFASDHGEGLYQHGVLQHGWIFQEQIRVPLIIRFPDGRTGRNAALVSLLDVLPILAEETALPLDKGRFDGINVLRETRETALAQREIRESVWPGECYALTGLDWKYWYFADEPDQLFDLREDPLETRNVILEHAAVAQRMRTELLALVAENKKKSPLEPQETIPEERKKQLEALGYMN